MSGNNVKARNVRSKVRVATQKTGKVSIKKENISRSVDVVEAVIPYVALEFEPNAVSELSVESIDNNKIKVDFNKTDSTTKVNIKFPGITSDDFKAIVDENGNELVTKYNPITDELSAKIDRSGSFSVVRNEKVLKMLNPLNRKCKTQLRTWLPREL